MRQLGKYKVQLLVLAVLPMLGLGGSSAGAGEPEKLEVRAPAVAQAVPVPGLTEVLGGSRGSFLDIAVEVDAAGNTFYAVATENILNTNLTWVDVYRYAPSGQVTFHDSVEMDAGFKIDDIDMTHSGSTLIVVPVTHSFDNRPRTRQVEQASFPGVFSHTRALDLERGGEGAYLVTNAQACNIDYDRISQMLDAKLAVGFEQFAQRFGNGGNIRAALEQKAKDAIDARQVLTVPMFDGPRGNGIVYSQLVNTSYSGAKEALKDARVVTAIPIPLPTPTPTVRP